MVIQPLIMGQVLLVILRGTYVVQDMSDNKSPEKVSSIAPAKTSAGKTIGNTANLKMPLEIKMRLPAKDWLYEGTYQYEGSGRPGGNMVQKAVLHLTLPRSSNWPVTVTGLEKDLQAWDEDPKTHKLVPTDSKTLMQKIPFTPMAMDQFGRFSKATYYCGGDPVAFLNELWPLPLTKLNIGETFREKVSFKHDLNYPYGVLKIRAEGGREITLLGTKSVDGLACAVVQIRGDLYVTFDPEEMQPYRMIAVSDLVFDVQNGVPLSVKQHIEIKTKGMEDGKPTDCKIAIAWDLKRRNSTKPGK